MPARECDRFDQEFAQLARKFRQLLALECSQIGGGLDGIQQFVHEVGLRQARPGSDCLNGQNFLDTMKSASCRRCPPFSGSDCSACKALSRNSIASSRARSTPSALT